MPNLNRSKTQNFPDNELFRSATVLLAGMLVSMTFLLVIGIQRPNSAFKAFFFLAVVLLSLSLAAYVVNALLPASQRWLRVIHGLVFGLGVVATAIFMIVTADFFFNPPVTPQPSQSVESSEQAPSSGQPTEPTQPAQ